MRTQGAHTTEGITSQCQQRAFPRRWRLCVHLLIHPSAHTQRARRAIASSIGLRRVWPFENDEWTCVTPCHSFSLFRKNVAQPGRIFANGALSNTQDVVDEDDDDVFFSPMTTAASESEGGSDDVTTRKGEDAAAEEEEMEHEDKKEENDQDVAANNEDDADSKQDEE
ncbi:hypothetical protein FI667_g16963, partial [Globisporangium splendens]